MQDSFADRSESLSVPIYLSGIQCDGSERGILNCSNSSMIPSSVIHLQDAYIVCRPRSRAFSGTTDYFIHETVHKFYRSSMGGVKIRYKLKLHNTLIVLPSQLYVSFTYQARRQGGFGGSNEPPQLGG